MNKISGHILSYQILIWTLTKGLDQIRFKLHNSLHDIFSHSSFSVYTRILKLTLFMTWIFERGRKYNAKDIMLSRCFDSASGTKNPDLNLVDIKLISSVVMTVFDSPTLSMGQFFSHETIPICVKSEIVRESHYWLKSNMYLLNLWLSLESIYILGAQFTDLLLIWSSDCQIFDDFFFLHRESKCVWVKSRKLENNRILSCVFFTSNNTGWDCIAVNFPCISPPFVWQYFYG